MNLEELKRKMDKEHYIYDDTLSTVLYVALQLGRPLLIEGAAGVGKTEVAKVMVLPPPWVASLLLSAYTRWASSVCSIRLELGALVRK